MRWNTHPVRQRFVVDTYTYMYFVECENNMYGAGCSEECGHCVNGEQCNPVHGTCRNGCETGYYKKRCKRGRASNTMHTDTS